MVKYLTFFRMRLVSGLQYRAAALAGMSTQLIWGTMEILLYRAFWLQSPEKFPMGMDQLSAYVWLQQAFLAFFAMWSWERELLRSVKDGTVAYELTRPTDLYGMWMARSVALRLSRGLLRCLPILLVGALIPAPYGLRLPADPVTFALFLVSMVLMLAVVCAATMMLYSLTFFLTDPNGLTTLTIALADILGGAIIPLPFMPSWLRRVAELSPFGSMQNVPLRIYSGSISLDQAPSAMALQLFWAAALIVLGKVLMDRGLRKTVILGG